MMEEYIAAMKRHVAAMIGQVGTTRLGTISSVNPMNYTAKVLIQPDNVQSGWLPIAASMVGAGWGIVSTPTPGEQVVVVAQEGDIEHGLIVGRVFSNAQQPPQTYTDITQQDQKSYAQPGEFAMVHKSGRFLRMNASGFIMDGDLQINGIVHATGDISSDKNLQAKLDVQDGHGTVDRLRGNYDLHVHGTSPTTSRPDAE